MSPNVPKCPQMSHHIFFREGVEGAGKGVVLGGVWRLELHDIYRIAGVAAICTGLREIGYWSRMGRHDGYRVARFLAICSDNREIHFLRLDLRIDDS